MRRSTVQWRTLTVRSDSGWLRASATSTTLRFSKTQTCHTVSSHLVCFLLTVVTLLVCLLMCTGDLLQLGEAAVFRFNHPEEAHKLKEVVSQ